MRRYKAAQGMTDVTWTLDGEALGACGGGGQVHQIFPFAHRALSPIVIGLDVVKSITALSDGSFLAVNSIPDPRMPLDFLKISNEDGVLRVSSWQDCRAYHTHGRRIERMAGDHIVNISIARSLGYASALDAKGEPIEEDWGEAGNFLDADANAADTQAVVVSEHALRFIDADGGYRDAPTREGASYVTLHGDGRYALISRDTLWVFDAQGRLSQTMMTPSLTAVEWHDGTDHIYTGHADGMLRAWHAITGEMLAEAQVHEGLISEIEHAPGRDLVATSSWDTTVRLTSTAPLTGF